MHTHVAGADENPASEPDHVRQAKLAALRNRVLTELRYWGDPMDIDRLRRLDTLALLERLERTKAAGMSWRSEPAITRRPIDRRPHT